MLALALLIHNKQTNVDLIISLSGLFSEVSLIRDNQGRETV